MRHIRKRLLASAVAVMLVCSMMPLSALAAEEEIAAEAAATESTETVSEPSAEVTTEVPESVDPAAEVTEEASEPAAEAPAEEAETEEPVEEDTTEAAEPEEASESESAEDPAEEAAEPVETAVAEEPEETVQSVGSAVTYDAEKAEQETEAAAAAVVTLADEIDQPVFIVTEDGKTFTVGQNQTIQDVIDHINSLEDKEGYTIIVPSGTYGRFTVLDGMNGLTVKGAEGAEVIINVVDNSDAPAKTSGGYPDTAGVSIRHANNVTLQNLKFQLGVQTNPWYSAAVSNYSESGNKGNNFTIDG